MGAGGASGQMLGRYIAKGVGAQLDDFEKQTIDAAQKAAKRLGGKLKLTPGARTGHEGMQGMEESMKSFPMTARRMHRITDHNQKILNQAALRAIGQDGKQITPNHIGKAYRDLGRKFDDFRNVQEPIPVSMADARRMQRAADEYAEEWGVEVPARVGNTLRRFYEAARGGGISGREYVTQRSKLSKRAYKQMTSEGGDRELGLYLHEAVDTLDDAALRVAPKGRYDEYARVRDQYRNLKEVTRFVDKKGNLRGPAMATRLAQKDARYQRGDSPQFQETSDLHDLVRFAGQHQPIVGDSGTATRASLPLIGTTMAGGGGAGYMLTQSPTAAVTGALAVPAAVKGAQGAYLSPMAQPFMTFPGLLGRSSGAARQMERLMQGAGAGAAGLIGADN